MPTHHHTYIHYRFVLTENTLQTWHVPHTLDSPFIIVSFNFKIFNWIFFSFIYLLFSTFYSWSLTNHSNLSLKWSTLLASVFLNPNQKPLSAFYSFLSAGVEVLPLQGHQAHHWSRYMFVCLIFVSEYVIGHSSHALNQKMFTGKLQFLVLFERHDKDIKIVGSTFVYFFEVVVNFVEFGYFEPYIAPFLRNLVVIR